MKNILTLFLIFFTKILFGQCMMFFPNYADQAQRSVLSYSYLKGFPIEVKCDSLYNISCNNGKIIKDTTYLNNTVCHYFCYPEQLGNCKVTISIKCGVIERLILIDSITVIETPKLDIEFLTKFSQESNKINYHVIGKHSNTNVSHEYRASFFICKVKDKNGKTTNFLIDNELTEEIDLTRLTETPIEELFGSTITFEVYLFGKRTDLFAGYIKKEIKIEK